MPPPKSLDAYRDCEDYYEQAINSEKGIALTLESPGQVTHLIMRMNYYRTLLRNNSKLVYPVDSPLHGKCAFDGYECRPDPDNSCRMFIRPVQTKVISVEKL